RIQDISIVKKTPINTTTRTDPAATNEEKTGGNEAATNTVVNIIRVGNRPLQGTKLLVRIAIRRSRGESITRVEITPAALHPKPIAIDSACLPCAPAFLNIQSRLKATLGK